MRCPVSGAPVVCAQGCWIAALCGTSDVEVALCTVAGIVVRVVLGQTVTVCGYGNRREVRGRC